ncbi:Rrf2 family transcriptional regulator [Aliiroseovarius crassostreae]|nr:Rrf2 family transcriptional regulator [Aliiroseovarius crassostreae]
MHTGQAIEMLSEELNIKHSVVEDVVKRLRKAEYLPSSSGRGRSAHHVSDLEVARLLIALMSSEGAAGAAERCKFFASLPLQPSVSTFPKSWTLKEERDTFEQHLVALLRFLRREPDQAGNVYISTEIYLGAAAIVYEDRPRDPEQHFSTRFEAPIELSFEERHPYWSGVHRSAEIVGAVLARIAARVDLEAAQQS